MLFSGKGKHRRPAKATRVAALAGVTGVAIAAPLMAAGNASAAGRHAARTYTVQEGDSLASIADSLGLDGGWRALYAENKDRIGADPSNIVAGQTLDTGAE